MSTSLDPIVLPHHALDPVFRALGPTFHCLSSTVEVPSGRPASADYDWIDIMLAPDLVRGADVGARKPMEGPRTRDLEERGDHSSVSKKPKAFLGAGALSKTSFSVQGLLPTTATTSLDQP